MKQQSEQYNPHNSFVRVATARPKVAVANVTANVTEITRLYKQATEQDVSLVVFPELCITGYTLGDLVQQQQLLRNAEHGLIRLAKETKNQPTAMVVSLPLLIGNNLYNCAAFLADGQIKGINPKTHLPVHNEFYENRWFESGLGLQTAIHIDDMAVPVDSEQLFSVAGALVGIEICASLWSEQPLSGKLATLGATIIVNPSASTEQAAKPGYRRDMVRMQSYRLHAAYVYAGCDVTESTAEIVMSGHQIVAAAGQILAENKPYGHSELTIADIDMDHLSFDRYKQHTRNNLEASVINTGIQRRQKDLVTLPLRNPFLPHDDAAHEPYLSTLLQTLAEALATRLKNSGQERFVLGLSGGVDSALALVVATEACRILDIEPDTAIHAITMPGQASSSRTQDNATQLAGLLGAESIVVPIGELATAHLTAIGHDNTTQDIAFETTQVRARFNLLFGYANMHSGLVLGTVDLSELALGYFAYAGDQMSHYDINSGVPKTLARLLLKYATRLPHYHNASKVIEDILDTPISPELTHTDKDTISQVSEQIIGPYELHDFFLYHLVRWGDAPGKISYLAKQAFKDTYTSAEIDRWLKVFFIRFARNQFKREAAPNGPKVTEISLSPRSDWRMPPDSQALAMWS